MPNVDRASMTRLIYRRLTDPDFRDRLSAVAPDGSLPIIVTLRDDPMTDLLHKVATAGGAANVVVPALNGFLVIDMEVGGSSASAGPGSDTDKLTADCTVGVFVARLAVDNDAATYHLIMEPDDEATAHDHAGGRAKVVALGS